MIKKNYSKTGKVCRVTFKYQNDEKYANAALAGDFNGWLFKNHPMRRLKNGSFSITITLRSGNSYQFRYVFDHETWGNDEEADSYVQNDYGERNSVIAV